VLECSLRNDVNGASIKRVKRGGATITGDGRIALILDLPELLDVYGRR